MFPTLKKRMGQKTELSRMVLTLVSVSPLASPWCSAAASLCAKTPFLGRVGLGSSRGASLPLAAQRKVDR